MKVWIMAGVLVILAVSGFFLVNALQDNSVDESSKVSGICGNGNAKANSCSGGCSAQTGSCGASTCGVEKTGSCGCKNR